MLKWDLDQNQKRDSQFQHLYLSIENEGDVFFASIVHPQNYFVWKSGDRRVVPRFRNGPQYGEEYTFKLFYNRGVSISHGKPVIFLNPNDPTPTATPTFTQTPTPLPTFNPNDPPQEITIDLPGLPEGAVPLQLVWIPPGTFMMGSDSVEDSRLSHETPRHEVTISKGFYMGKYEVTNAQYRLYDKRHDSRAFKGISMNEDNQPVVYVSWNDAIKYCDWLNSQRIGYEFTLPTEAQWEYVCRAGSTEQRFWEDKNESACEYANVTTQSTLELLDRDGSVFDCEDGYFVTAPVGSFKPNAFGIHDMLGNVWEKCLDWYNSNYYSNSPTHDPTGPLSGSSKISRGGSWDNGILGVRSAHRSSSSSSYSGLLVGFRITASFNEEFLNTPTPQPKLDPNGPPQEITVDLPGLPEGAVPLQLVWILPGDFLMGTPANEITRWSSDLPQREVNISSGFYLGKFELTRAQHRVSVGSSINPGSMNLPILWNQIHNLTQYIEWRIQL